MFSENSFKSTIWIKQPQWLFFSGSVFAALVALIAEGPGSYLGATLLALCVLSICCWSLKGIPSLEGAVGLVSVFIVLLGWTAENPESALFQPIVLAIAIGWRIEQLPVSLIYLGILASVPVLGNLGASEDDWAWWNWTVGTIFTWTLGRIIRLLEQTLDELIAARSRLIEMAAREERHRISADVHDLVGHSMTAVLLNVRAARQTLTTDPSDAEKALADAEEIAMLGIADIRKTLHKLRSANLSDCGDNNDANTVPLTSLPDGESIRSLLSRQDHISITVNGDLESLQGPIAVSLYRILQECITNISKHASSGSGNLELNVNSNHIRLTSQNPISRKSAGSIGLTDKSLGLIGMRERVTNLGGTFEAGLFTMGWQVDIRIPTSD